MRWSWRAAKAAEAGSKSEGELTLRPLLVGRREVAMARVRGLPSAPVLGDA